MQRSPRLSTGRHCHRCTPPLRWLPLETYRRRGLSLVAVSGAQRVERGVLPCFAHVAVRSPTVPKSASARTGRTTRSSARLSLVRENLEGVPKQRRWRMTRGRGRAFRLLYIFVNRPWTRNQGGWWGRSDCNEVLSYRP